MASDTVMRVCDEKTEYKCQSGQRLWKISGDPQPESAALKNTDDHFLTFLHKGECIKRINICNAQMDCLRKDFKIRPES